MNFEANYELQDKVLHALSGKVPEVYLTGGTALSRFYLDHRFSEDLDFFADNIDHYPACVLNIRRILEGVGTVSKERIIQVESFSRIWISDPNDTELKIEIVNDIGKRWGVPVEVQGVFIDTPANILANKLTALVSRDEPKDPFDIVCISGKYSFHWDEVFTNALEKAFINEPDIAIRLKSFPVEELIDKLWLKKPVNLPEFRKKLETVIQDFTFARTNSLGKDQPDITKAMPYKKQKNRGTD